MVLGFFKKMRSQAPADEAAETEAAPAPVMAATGAAKSQASEFARDYLERQSQKAAKRLSKDMQKNSHQRQDERQGCFTIANLTFPETGARLDGVLLDASRHGLTFRPASHYIQNRVGERVRIDCGQLVRIGIVRSARADGYGVQVLEPFADDELAAIYAESIDLTKAA